jgi:sensor histidine kinase YesM
MQKNKSYLLYSILSAIPVFAILTIIIKHAINKEQLIVLFAAFVFTLVFFALLYGGRYVSRIWFAGSKAISKKLLIQFAVFLITCLLLMIFVIQIRSSNGVPFFIAFVFLFLVFSFSLGVFIKLTRSFIQSQIQIAEISAANSKSELQLLQYQLSPHFLFNTLNNLYGISISEHEKMPALLLKLSELLRYSVYDAKELYVPLKGELAYLNNYIEFEKLRIGDRLELKTDIEEIRGENIKISPMLLIVFVENAFKHSKNTNDEHVFISISLKLWNGSILFAIKNSFRNANNEGNIINNNCGLGLENVKKRLDLLYPNQYDLNITEEKENIYTVNLRLIQK